MTDPVEPAPEDSAPPVLAPPPVIAPTPALAPPPPAGSTPLPELEPAPEPRSAPPPLPAPPRPRWRDHAWAALCHLCLFLVIPTVFLGAVVTFFVWQLRGRTDPEVEREGREALNFQINVALLTALLGVTCLGVALVPIVWLVAAILCVIAALRVARGDSYRYPWILRVVTH